MRLLLLLTLCVTAVTSAETVYRYQDENGRWHFTDRKPPQQHETLEMVVAAAVSEEPQIMFRPQADGGQQLVAVNPWRAPVQFEIRADDTQIHVWLAGPQSEVPVMQNGQPMVWKEGYEYRYIMGRPVAQGDRRPLQPPIPAHGRFRISQGFNGTYSHKQQPSRHAVDIVMQVGDGVHAARDGLVVTVKDDYHMGGVDRFFLDKANYVRVLHDDDTFGIYAHILLGSAEVKEGDRVKAGDLLASAGTSGYSTGPHLHFVVQRNDGKRIVSEPFRFQLGQGIFPPVAGQWLTRE